MIAKQLSDLLVNSDINDMKPDDTKKIRQATNAKRDTEAHLRNHRCCGIAVSTDSKRVSVFLH
jgi:hypothetical protein